MQVSPVQMWQKCRHQRPTHIVMSLQPGRQARHSAINDLIKRSLASANVPCIREPVDLTRSDNKRPDIMSLVPWREGRLLVWDYTCCDTLAPTYLSKSVLKAGSAAEMAEDRKCIKYREIAEVHVFIPICIETFGSHGPSARSFLKELGERLSEAVLDRRASAFLQQTLGMYLQRSNANCIIQAMPKNETFDELHKL